jgi:methyl-accepting chemotaxis protein
MFRFLSNVPIFRRMIIIFALAMLIPGVVIVLLGNFYLSFLNTQGQAIRTSFDAQSLAAQQEDNLQRMNALLQAKFYQIFASHSGVIQDPSLFASGGLVDGEIRALEADFDRNLPIYQDQYELATSPNMSIIRSILQSNDPANAARITQSQQNALNQVIGPNQAWAKYKNDQDHLANNLESLQLDLQKGISYTPVVINQKYQQDYAILHSAILDFTNLRNSWQQVVQDAVDMGKAVTSVGAAQVQPIFIYTTVALFLIILAILVTGIIVNQTITRPLSQLAVLTARIAEGRTEARANVPGRDEIALVANAMNNMLNNIVYLMQDAQKQRDILQARVEKLVSEVCNVGEGDLRIQAEVTSDALGVLADSFNYMVEELSSLVVRVKMMAHEVENSTTLTFQSMVQLVGNADVQIQQIGRATQEVEHMADVNRQVAERAQSLYMSAHEARQMAQIGRDSVQQTIEGMGRIQAYVQDTATKVQALGESSREIDNIVGVIATIAQQTNRLALDAAVQAATAGEHGKGFGAVAVDIRRLAERAKDQANTIARIVRGVGENIDAATVSMQDTERETAVEAQLTEETGKAFESIFNVVEHQGSEIEVINQLATHQLQSSNAVVRIMQGVSESTQQSSINTRGAARNMEHLARLAEQLLNSVEAFKLRENLDYVPSSQSMLSSQNDGKRRVVNAGPAIPVSSTPVGAGQVTKNNSGLLGFPSLDQPNGPLPYSGRTTSGPMSSPNQGSQPLSPRRGASGPMGLSNQPRNNSGPMNFPNQGNQPRNNSGPMNSPNQSGQLRNNSGPMNFPNQGNQPRNNSGPMNSPNQSPYGNQKQNGNSPIGLPSPDLNKQNKLKQTRLQRPPAPPENQ